MPEVQDPIQVGQAVSLYLLQRWDQVCRELDTEYYLTSGTLLGAIREGGFIPWDDDVDVVIPRPAFERLRRLSQQDQALFGEDCYLVDGRDVDEQGRLVLRTSDSRIGHMRMDVFVLDVVPDSRILAALLAWVAWAARVGANLGDGTEFPDPGRPVRRARLAAVVARAIGPGRLRKLHRAAVRQSARWGSGKTLNALTGSRPMGRQRPAAWYPGQRTAAFEGHSFPVPNNAEGILECIYGRSWRTPTRSGATQHTLGSVRAKFDGKVLRSR